MARILFLALFLIAAPAWGAAWLMASPSSVDFGSVPESWPVTSRTVYLKNYGDEPAKSISVYAFCGSEFHIYDICYGDIRPGGSCSIQIDFLAAEPQVHSCSIDVYTIGAGSLRIPVRATVTAEQNEE